MKIKNEIAVKVGELEITGNSPIVIVGPNGGGKSKLGVDIVKNNKPSERISAKRLYIPPNNIPLQQEKKAEDALNSNKNETRENTQAYTQDISALITALFAEDNEASFKVGDLLKKGDINQTQERNTLQNTKLERVFRIWKNVFSKRELHRSKSNLRVSSTLKSKAPVLYAPTQMSDGEQIALYLISSVIKAPSGVLVVDEPELHMHLSLTKKLWNNLEQERNDIRFVYITHDTRFAESRSNARYVVVNPEGNHEVLKPDASIPPELTHLILGAIAGELTPKKIVFCEGSIDESLLEAWFSNTNMKVTSVGGCDRVIACFDAVKTGKVMGSIEPIGVVDRDDRSEDEIQTLEKRGLFVLPISELESLACLKGVFFAVGKHLRKTQSKIDDAFNKATKSIRNELGKIMHLRILQRCKDRINWKSTSQINSISKNPDLAALKQEFCGKIGIINKEMEPAEVFNEENDKLQNALNADWSEILKLFPGKSYIKPIASELGFTTKAHYLQLITNGLQPGFENTKIFREDLIKALEPFLPNRF